MSPISRLELKPMTDHENPHNPTRPPIHSTHHRMTFRAVTLQAKDDPGKTTEKETAPDLTNEPRSMFMLRAANKGPKKARASEIGTDSLSTGPGSTLRQPQTGKTTYTMSNSVAQPAATPISTQSLEAGPSRPPAQNDQPKKRKTVRSDGLTGYPPAPSRSISPLAPEPATQLIAESSSGPTLVTGGLEGDHTQRSRIPSRRKKLVVRDAADLETLDLTGLAINARSTNFPANILQEADENVVEITPEAQAELGIANSFPAYMAHHETLFSKKEVQKIRDSRPLHGPGSRGGGRTRSAVDGRDVVGGGAGKMLFVGGESANKLLHAVRVDEDQGSGDGKDELDETESEVDIL